MGFIYHPLASKRRITILATNVEENQMRVISWKSREVKSSEESV